MMDIKILVATHKKYWMPEDDVYIPVHVGKAGKNDLGYIGDDSGDNISFKNSSYCELTALYWAWKNLECEYIGLCHYRRYFSKNKYVSSVEQLKSNILAKDDYYNILNKYDMILPKLYKFKNLTLFDQYEKAHYKKDLDNTLKVIEIYFPDYVTTYYDVLNRKTGYFCNMFVMKKSEFDKYCEWLFTILFELEKITDIREYDSYQKRIYGFLAERLFNIWLAKNRHNVCEVPVINLEGKADVNRLKRFLHAWKYKVTGKF